MPLSKHFAQMGSRADLAPTLPDLLREKLHCLPHNHLNPLHQLIKTQGKLLLMCEQLQQVPGWRPNGFMTLICEQ